MNQTVAVVLAYVLGSIPFAYLAGRAKGVDIRTVGSKNVGATNVFRTLGKRIGIAVMLLDIGKGVAATLIARALTDSPWPLVPARPRSWGTSSPCGCASRAARASRSAAGRSSASSRWCR